MLVAQGVYGAPGDRVIDDVNVETKSGNPFPAQIVRANINSVPGATFDPAVLSDDIERLYKSGYVFDVEAAVENDGPNKVDVIFAVQPVPRVRWTEVEGNRYVDSDDILDETTLEEGEPLDVKQIAEDTRAIQTYYENKGYHGTKVTSYQRPVPGTDTVDVVWKIDPEPRYKLRDVEVVGNTVFEDDKLLDSIRTDPTIWSWILPVGYFNPEILEQDRNIITRMYADRGYLDCNIPRVSEDVSDNRKWMRVTLHIEEGAQYTVDSVSVTGNKLFGADEIMSRVSLAEGEPYSAATARNDVTAIEDLYQPKGYLDMRCRPVVDKDVQSHTVSIEYRIQEGVPSHIRDIYISGNLRTRDEVIRRELLIHPGDLANQNRIDASKSVLMNLNYFKSVAVNPRSTGEEGRKDLNIEVEEKRTGQLMVGAGFSSESAVLGTLEVSQSNFDITDWPRFTGDGQRMRVRLQVGTEYDEFLVSFVEPWWLNRRLRLELNAYSTIRDQDEYLEETIGASVSVSRRLWDVWRQSVGLRYETTQLRDFETRVSQELLDEEGNYDVATLLFTMSRDTRDRFIFPTRGSRLRLEAGLQPEMLGSYSDIYRLEAEGALYFPLIAKSVLRLNGELGVTDHVGGDPVAIIDRYFAGGTSTFRGFDRREVSPADRFENPLGGQSLLLGTAEVSYPFNDMVRGSIFCDMGNVWRGAYDWEPDKINASVGVGVHLQLPVGPIRLDYGFPVLTQQDHLDDSGRLHFNLGYIF